MLGWVVICNNKKLLIIWDPYFLLWCHDDLFILLLWGDSSPWDSHVFAHLLSKGINNFFFLIDCLFKNICIMYIFEDRDSFSLYDRGYICFRIIDNIYNVSYWSKVWVGLLPASSCIWRFAELRSLAVTRTLCIAFSLAHLNCSMGSGEQEQLMWRWNLCCQLYH